jgi:hypothetical protein
VSQPRIFRVAITIDPVLISVVCSFFTFSVYVLEIVFLKGPDWLFFFTFTFTAVQMVLWAFERGES